MTDVIGGVTFTGGCVIGPYYQSILPQYNGMQYNAAASFMSSIGILGSALYVGTQKDSRTSTPIAISGLNLVDPNTYIITSYTSGSTQYNPYGNIFWKFLPSCLATLTRLI